MVLKYDEFRIFIYGGILVYLYEHSCIDIYFLMYKTMIQTALILQLSFYRERGVNENLNLI